MKTKNNKMNNLTGVWLTVVILLLMLSVGMLASIYKGISAGENNVIGLFPNKSVKALSTNVNYIPAEPKPDMDAFDDNVSWETYTDVDLFKTSYVGNNGEIIAESANGDKIIAPGTTNSYRFSLKNTGNVSLNYTLNLESVFALANQKLPFQVRLCRGDDWIVGSDADWTTIDKLNSMIETSTLDVGKYITYTMEWQWPFENDETDMLLLQDINDTILGNVSSQANTNFRLTITTVSEVTPGAVATDENGEPIFTPVISNKAVTYIGEPLLFSFGLLFMLLLLLLWRKRIYVTGFAPVNGTMKWKRQEDTVRIDGRFVFPRIAAGKHTFTLIRSDGTELSLRWALKHKSNVEGISFENQDSVTTVIVGKSIRAIELYLSLTDEGLALHVNKWAAIDRKNNVYTTEGKKEPDDHRCNTTPGGLTVDKQHNLSF